MAFDVNTITLQGAIAVASATTGNKLVIDGCDATTDVLTQAQAAQIVNRPATPGSTTTEIALAGSTDNHVFAYAEFLQGQSTGGDFNSFFLYGHMEDDSSTVFVISVCSSTAPVHVPASGDVTNRTEVQFDLTFTPNAEVVKVADTSMYCTRGEFLILKERAVTTHAEGTPTTGEAQDIYGNKTFKNNIISNHIEPTTDDIGVIGTSTKRYAEGRFKEFYATTLIPGTIKASGADEDHEASVTIYNTYFADLQHHCTVGTSQYWIAGVYATGINTNAITALSGSDISVYSSNIIPGQHSGVTDNVDLGSSTRVFKNLYANSVHANTITAITDNTPVSIGGLYGIRTEGIMQYGGCSVTAPSSPSASYPKAYVDVGFDHQTDAPQVVIGTLSAGNDRREWIVTGNTITTYNPGNAYSYQIGEENNYGITIYCSSIHGIMPNASSDTHIPEKGCILFVKVTASSTLDPGHTSLSRQQGDEISVGGEVANIQVSDMNGTNTSSISLSSYTFKVLSVLNVSAGGYDTALVMRVA